MTRRTLLTLALVGFAALLPSFLWGPGKTHDYQYAYLWTQHFGEQMAAGHVYERWLPHSFEGLGSPSFYFYPPLAYWVTGAIVALGVPVPQAINLGALALLVASGLAMHRWLAERAPPASALGGAICYMVAPYHLYDFYVRGALAEFAAFIWLPLIALAIDRLPTRRGTLLLAASFAGLLITHLPMAMLTGLFLVAPLLVARCRRDPAILLPAAGAGLLSAAAAAFYLLPVLTLQDHVSIAMLWTTDQASTWSIWSVHPALFPSLSVALILLARPVRSLWGGIVAVTAIAALGLIPLLWEVAILDKVQFPWRLFCIAEFAAVTAMVRHRARPLLTAPGRTLLIFPYLATAFTAAAYMRAPIDYATIDRIGPDAVEYLPAGFDTKRVRRDALVHRRLDADAWRSLPRGDTIRVTWTGPVTIGRAAFPIWQVMREGTAVPSTGPLIRFDATPGVYRVVRVALWQERWGAAISLAALALFVLLALPGASLRRLCRRPIGVRRVGHPARSGNAARPTGTPGRAASRSAPPAA